MKDKLEFIFAGLIPVFLALSNILYTKLILTSETESIASNYLYCSAIIMSIFTLQEIGISNQFSTYLYDKRNTKIGSILVMYVLLQLLLTGITSLFLIQFDAKIILTIPGIFLLSFSLLLSKKIWGFLYTLAIRKKLTNFILLIATFSVIIPLILLYQDVQISYEWVSTIILVYFVLASITMWPKEAINLSAGYRAFKELVFGVKKSAITFNIINLLAVVLIIGDRRLLFLVGDDFGQVIMSVSLIALNVGTLITSGMLKLVWRDKINVSKTLILLLKKYSLISIIGILIFVGITVLVILRFFEIPLNNSNIVFTCLIVMSMPFMIFNQLISVEQYAKGEYDTISIISLVSILMHLLLVVIMIYFSDHLQLLFVALKWLVIYCITALYLAYRFVCY